MQSTEAEQAALVELKLSDTELGLCLEHLGSRDLSRAMLVCKRWAAALKDTPRCTERLKRAAAAADERMTKARSG